MKIDKEKDNEIIRMRDKLGCTWRSIGSAYGISRQGAQDYYKRAKRRQNAKRSPLIRLMDKLYKKITK